jgi:hypothetical protein
LKNKIEGKKKRGRRRKELLDDFKGTTVYWNLKEKALDLPPKTTRFGRGYRAEREYVMKMIIEDLMIKMERSIPVEGKSTASQAFVAQNLFCKGAQHSEYLITRKSQ